MRPIGSDTSTRASGGALHNARLLRIVERAGDVAKYGKPLHPHMFAMAAATT